MTDFRALLKELLEWAEHTSAHYVVHPDVILRARAALSEPDPVAPTDEELIRPIMWMLDDSIYDNDKGEIAQSLRELVARWGQP